MSGRVQFEIKISVTAEARARNDRWRSASRKLIAVLAKANQLLQIVASPLIDWVTRMRH